jgi:hypothetical protein
MNTNESNDLTDMLATLEQENAGHVVMLGDVIQSLNSRGFGPLLMVPALLAILPTGAIPGVPALCGIMLCLLTAQIIAGRHYPWLPERLRAIRFRKGRMSAIIKRIRPMARTIDRVVSPRFEPLSHPAVQRLAAMVCFLLGVLMILIGFIPFMPSVLALPVLLFALGLNARDGALTLSGFFLTLAAFVMLLWLSGVMGGEDRLQLHISAPQFMNAQNYSVDLNQLDNFR